MDSFFDQLEGPPPGLTSEEWHQWWDDRMLAMRQRHEAGRQEYLKRTAAARNVQEPRLLSKEEWDSLKHG